MLDHITGSLSPVARIYNRHDYLHEMREAWENHILSIIKQPTRISDNLKYVENVLAGMTDIVARYAIEKKFTVHPVTKKGRVLADAKIILWPTKSFVQSQIENNIHHSKLDDATGVFLSVRCFGHESGD